VEKRSTRGISGTTYVPTQRGIPSIPVLRDDRTHTKMKADLSAAIYRVWFFGLQRCPVVTFPFHYYRLPGCVYGVLQSVLATAEFLSISDLRRLPRSRQISGSISIPSSELQTQLRHNLRLRQIVPFSVVGVCALGCRPDFEPAIFVELGLNTSLFNRTGGNAAPIALLPFCLRSGHCGAT